MMLEQAVINLVIAAPVTPRPALCTR